MVLRGGAVKRVGFILSDRSDGWLGGLNYLRNLIAAILANPDRRIHPVLIVPSEMPAAQLTGFPEVEMAREPLANVYHLGRRLGRIGCRLLGRDFALERVMARHRIDLLSHSFGTGARSPWNSIDWIADFQHVRMPQFFTPQECAARDATFRAMIDRSRLILVSSADAKSDLVKFAPDATTKVRVLYFVSGFDNLIAPTSRIELEQRFGFSGPYFHLPNQFWAHKNHGVVLEALAILKQRGVDVLVLATGKTHDNRNMDYFDGLMARVAVLGIDDHFRPLGIVSLPALYGLMLNSVALINPSQFEGWSTTVEESKSLGLPMILSDIPVHVEQAPPLGRYFRAGSAELLADSMAAALDGYDPTVMASARAQAAADLPRRISAFGQRFEDIALEAIGRAA